MSGSKPQIAWVNAAKAMGILLVVFGHSYPFEVEIPAALDWLRSFIYTFHMPLFVCLSGFLTARLSSVQKKGPWRYIGNRAMRLLTPYFALSLLFFVPKILASAYINDQVTFSFSYFLETMFSPRNNVWGHFWFLPMLFGMEILAAAYSYLLRKSTLWGSVVAVLSFGLWFLPQTTNWLSVNDILHYLPWMLLGMCVGNGETTDGKLEKLHWSLCLIPLLVGVGLFLLRIKYLGILIAAAMILFVMMLSMKLSGSKMLAFLGRNSFPVFIMSWPCQAAAEILLNRMLHLPVLAVMPVMFLSGLFGPLLVIALVRGIEKKFSLRYLKPIIGMS